MQHSTGYIVAFATAVCFACALVVASSAVGLKPRQEENQLLDRQKQVLGVAGLMKEGERLNREEITRRFDASMQAKVVELESGRILDDSLVAGFDQAQAAKDPATSKPAPANAAKVLRLPDRALIYEVIKEGKLVSLILPIEGYGLWGTLYGYIALEPDLNTVQGITFYQHKETPGLGGEVDNPRWKALWPGRKVFDEKGEPVITLKKGQAGPPSEDPYQVDGLSGATITSRGVGNLVRFWLGDNGFGPLLENLRAQNI